jgi:mRNA interferase MazF
MPATSGNVPDAGDILWIDFGAPAGHEQGGRRPAFVVSPASYNRTSSLMLVCPVTRNDRPWPFKVALPKVGRLAGYILVDQIRSIDPALRAFQIHGRAPAATLAMVQALLVALLGLRP